jgi:hypothetical protein
MKNKAFTIAVIIIAGSWFACHLTHIHFRSQRSKSRHKEISFLISEIGKIKKNMEQNTDESISKKDLLNVIEINRLQGQIRNLYMENNFVRSRNFENFMPEFIPLILLVAISMKIGVIDNKLKIKLP